MAAIEVHMPKIGLTMTEGKVIEWAKKVGDRVEKGETLFVFETEKTTFEVEAPQAGWLARIVADVEDTVDVGQLVGLLVEQEGEPADSVPAPAAAPPAPQPSPPPPAHPEGRLLKPTGMRRIIAERMLAAKRETAQTYMVATLDMTALLAARERLAGEREHAGGPRLTITDLLLKAFADAVAAHPELNSRWTPEGILQLDRVHLGLALALDDGLVVAVIHDAGAMSLAGIAAARSALVERGRAGQLRPDDIRGSTVTLSSLGMFGVEEFTAILNPPETAILAVGAVRDQPVAVDGRVVIRPMMKVTLTYDHRVIDGAGAARFLQALRDRVEKPPASA